MYALPMEANSGSVASRKVVTIPNAQPDELTYDALGKCDVSATGTRPEKAGSTTRMPSARMRARMRNCSAWCASIQDFAGSGPSQPCKLPMRIQGSTAGPEKKSPSSASLKPRSSSTSRKMNSWPTKPSGILMPFSAIQSISRSHLAQSQNGVLYPNVQVFM